ncbi:MAG: MFS transporter [Peptoniphilaceae bacterium]|nr:MFS transporter [Peptoniphilaceae bacterium]
MNHSSFWDLKWSAFFSSCIFYAPIALLVRTNQEISLSQFMFLQAAVSVSILVFELPTGYISDKWGHRNSLLLSQLGLFGARLILCFATRFSLFFLEALIEGLTFALNSGSLESTIFAECEGNDYAIHLAKVGNYSNAGFLFSTISFFGLYYFKNIQLLLVLSCAFAFLAFIILLIGQSGRSSLHIQVTNDINTTKSHHETVDRVSGIPATDAIAHLARKGQWSKLRELFHYCLSEPVFCFFFLITFAQNLIFLGINFFYLSRLENFGISERYMTFLILGYTAVQLLLPGILRRIENNKIKKSLFCFGISIGMLFLIAVLPSAYLVVPLMLLLPTTTLVLPSIVNESVLQKITEHHREGDSASILSAFSIFSDFFEVFTLFFISLIPLHSGSLVLFILAAVVLVFFLLALYLQFVIPSSFYK